MEKFTSSAKVIDGTLILTLPDAIKPVVWQMQLGQTKSSALEVRDSTDGTWVLVLKTPRMDILEIAPFSDKDTAVKALLAVSRAMEKAHGQLGSASNGNYPLPVLVSDGGKKSSFMRRALKDLARTFVALVIILGLLYGFGKFFYSRSQEPIPEMGAPSVSQQSSTPPLADKLPSGVPLPADDVLNNQ